MRDHRYGLIGLDLGTSMLKGVVIDLSGQIVTSGSIAMAYLAEGLVCEFDADLFYDRLSSLTRQLVSSLPADLHLVGLSMASASGNTVLVDNNGRPLRPAISWLDQRVTHEMETVFKNVDLSDTHRIVGWPFLNSFPLAHLAWLRIHQAEALQKAEKICLSTDYMTWRLTGKWGIDPSTATTFYLQDQVRQQWHQPFLDALEIDPDRLPQISKTGTTLGCIIEQAAAETGLPQGLPVILGAFDHPCAARGCGVLNKGQAMLSAGTSWVIFLPAEDRENLLKQKLLCDPFLREKGLWGGMASLPAISRKNDALIRRWISDEADRLAVFTQLACQATAGADGLIINLDRIDEATDFSGHTRQNIARALMEGTAFLLAAKMSKIKEAGMDVSHLSMVGGAAENAAWPHIVCAVLGQPISVINGAFSGAVGAAILAGCGVGIFADEWEAAEHIQSQRTWLYPDQMIHERYRQIFHNDFLPMQSAI